MAIFEGGKKSAASEARKKFNIKYSENQGSIGEVLGGDKEVGDRAISVNL